MFETDAERLQMLQSLGGQSVSSAQGEIVALFDNGFVENLDVNDRAPFLTCRTSDVLDRKLGKGSSVTANKTTYRVRRHEPDGTGMSILILENPQ